MNHIYRSIWNASTGTVTAVSEHAKCRGKKNSSGKSAVARSGLVLRSVSVAMALSCGAAAQASPTGGTVVAGDASISSQLGSTTIQQTTQNAALTWQSFDIGLTESVRFIQPNSNSVALNRVLGSDPSSILGSLSSNGKVFLVNPHGILFGTGAQVNVGGLVASTRNITDSDFMAGRHVFTGDSGGVVENRGSINAANGYVALLGASVSNEGVIAARLGTVALAAGSAFTLDVAGDGLLNVAVDTGAVDALVSNGGVVHADGGQVLMTARSASSLLQSAVNNTGLIQAQTIENHNGVIKLLGDMQSGTVHAGGTLDASAPNGGDGGFIDTSAAQVEIGSDTRVTTAAARGLTGSWLIDPTDYTIAASGGDITGAQLSSNLAGSNITIQSSAGSSGAAGDVNVNDTVAWSANRLTLNAQNNININTAMNASGTASLALEYGQGAVAAGNTSKVNVNAPVNLPAGNNFSTLLGSNGSVVNYTVITSLGAAASSTGTDLQGMRGNLAGRYVLGSNIDAAATSSWNAGAGFTSIGTDSTRFTGIFDGLGHTVSGLYINRVGSDFAGLFGFTAAGSMIRNVGLLGGNVISDSWGTGALIGALGGTVMNSYATSTVRGFQTVGGLVGVIDGGAIIDSHATGNVSSLGNGEVGGLVGLIWGATPGTVNNSYATGNVSSSAGNVGGLVGINWGTVTNSYATGAANGTDYIGGLIGNNGGNSGGSIVNSYATGTVSGRDRVGGLAGQNSTTITGSHATGAVIGSVSVGGAVGSNYGTLSNSYATGTVTGSFVTGGLIGTNRGPVSYSHATGTVTGGDQTAGLVGGHQNGSISYSYATGDVTASTGAAGGLVGYSSATISSSYASGAVAGVTQVGGLLGAMNGSSISNSYATGAVTGTGNVGGLVGNSTNGTITNTYATGAVSGTTDVGGLLGSRTNATVTNGYWNTTTSGQATSVAGTGLTTTQMQTASSFSGFTFTSTPGATGNAWVMIDVDGTLNNAGSAAGATRPMLASEYATTLMNAHQLQLMTMDLAASYTLGRDIDAIATGNASGVWSGSTFIPVGLSGDFTGSLNGLGHTVSNLTVNRPSSSLSGLFGVNRGSVSNIGLLGGSVTGSAYTGGLAGANYGTITGSYFTGTVSASGARVGGLVGANNGAIDNSYAAASVSSGHATGGLVGANFATVSNSYSTGNVAGYDEAGGLVGVNLDTVTNSYATGVVTSAGNRVGGLIGANVDTLTNSYATGTVTGNQYVGGLVGRNYGTLDTGYSIGAVSGNSNVGGLVGENTGTVNSGYWDTTTSGQATSASGTGLTTAQMRDPANFAGFNFTGTPGATGNNWVTVNTNGSLNGADSATRPMLASEYSTTITNGHQLQLMNMNLGASYTLGQDINVAATGTINDVWLSAGFTPVAAYHFQGGNKFSGSFDGLGHTITNLHINQPGSQYYIGLFGYIDTTGSVRNLGLIGGNTIGYETLGQLAGHSDGTVANSYATGNVQGSTAVGGLIGINRGTISDSYTSGTVHGSGGRIGGLVGVNDGGAISSSYAHGAVYGGNYVGGLVGVLQNNGTLDTSYATGVVQGSLYIGGLIGTNYGAISNSYASGAVHSADIAGGLVGANYGAIVNSYATGLVSSGNAAGGLTAGNNGGTITRSFWNTQTTGQASSIGGGTGLTTTQMMQLASFNSWNTAAPNTIAGAANSGATWRIYAGYAAPLLTHFLTPLALTTTATVTYNGAVQSASGVLPSGVLGSSATNAGVYSFYSNQQGYDLAGGSLTINRANLTLSGTRTYDGSTAFAGSSLTATGVAGETFAVTGSGDASNLASKNVQTSSTLATVTGLALGAGVNGGIAGNYNAMSTIGSSVSVTRAALTLSSVDVIKTYDGTLTAAGTATVTSGTLFGADAISGGAFAFTDKNAGSGNKSVTTTGVTVTDGNSGGNYSLSYANNTTSTIDRAVLTATVTADDKIYDGTAAATATLSIVGGLVGGETLGTINTASFNSKDVVDANVVTVDNITLSDGTNGGLASNYSLANGQSVVAHITPKALTATVVAPDKVYDGNASAVVHLNTLNGLIGSETLNASHTATFNSKDVATANLVTINSVSLSDGSNGGLASNYSLASGQTAAAHITPRELTVLGQVALDKIYDGTTEATLQGGSLAGVVAGETVLLSEAGTFATAEPGNGIAITAADSLNGTAAVNYFLTQPAGLTASIIAAVQPEVPPVIVTPPVEVTPPPTDVSPPAAVTPPLLPVTAIVTYTSAVAHAVSNTQIVPPPVSASPPTVSAPSSGIPAAGPMMTYDLTGLNLTVIAPDAGLSVVQPQGISEKDDKK